MNKTYERINWQNEPSIATPLNEVNLNKVDYSLNEVDNRVITLDTTKANQSDLLQTVKTVTYNAMTGVFTFEFWNGTTVTADLNIEKIPVSFSMSPQGVITMTTADGTQYTADVSELIKTYSFVDSTEIDFTVETDQSGNKNVTASIKAGSITGEKLQPNYLADCVTAKNGAESAAGSASTSAADSENSSEDSEAWAVGERNGQPVPSTDPAYENNAKWWAQHGTGSSFSGLTDTNFTNLQDGQIAKYNSTTHMWENTEDEGGLLPHFYIDSEAGSTVTVTTPSGGTITPTLMSSGHWECDVSTYGTYIVHAVLNGEDATKTVAVNEVREYHITDTHFSYTLSVYAPQDSMIRIEATGETYTDTGEGSTAVVFSLGQKETQYTITVTYDGLTRTDSVTTPSTSGQSGSKTIEFGTINLTLDADLIGETIVMTNGTATKNKVADSTSMVFYPNATGNWTISCQYDGETYYSEPNPVVVSSLSTPVSAEISLVHIPEGAVVTPTDDIQTWLKCANLNKSYTTLAEVLADRETFETLIADSNACDYMARSTTWAGNANGVVSTMSDYTGTEGTVSASSELSTNYKAWKAFDGTNSSSTDCWHSTAGTASSEHWIQFEFDNAVNIRKLWFRDYNNNVTARTSTFDVQCYVNDEWVTIKNVSYTFSQNAEHTVDLSSNAYTSTKYRLIGSGYYDGSSSYYLIFGQIQFYEGIVTDKSAMSLIGKYDYCSNELLSNATWCEAICNSDYFEEVLNVKVPVMTSNTTPSGECIASGSTSGSAPWYCFRDTYTTSDTGQYWQSDYQQNPWIGYKFPNKILLKKYFQRRTYQSSGSGRDMNTANIQASNDGINWVDLATNITINNNAPNELTQMTFPNISTKYQYFRIYEVAGSATGTLLTQVQFYGRASSNVSNTNGIIHTANGDTVTCGGMTYTADTNGIIEIDFSDFDEGVYTFGSTTAKNPDNLSQDYTKQFRITKSPYGGTTELYLMPDTVKTLYWWGYENTTIEVSNTGYGGQSKVQPTLNKNTNNFSASVGNNQEGSIGFYPLNFDASSISKINMIIDSLSMSSQYGQFGYGYTADGSTKPVRDGQHWGVSPNPTSNLKWSDTNIPTSSQKALWLWLYMGQNATISAMWYE